jgi:SOS-response transcriptional repressor LexA
MIGLTPEQRNTLLALQELTDELGMSPTIEELRERLGISSKGNLHVVLAGVAERGWIFIERHTHRGIRILHRLELEEPEVVGLFDAPHLFTERDREMIAALSGEQSRKEGAS